MDIHFAPLEKNAMDCTSGKQDIIRCEYRTDKENLKLIEALSKQSLMSTILEILTPAPTNTIGNSDACPN